LVNLLASVSAAHDGARIGHLGIVTHGGPGEIDVGNGNNLNLATLPNQSPALEQLRSKLTNDARLDLYACSVASGAGGKTFVDELAAATGTAVFASDNPVGTVPGADFVWEYHTGQAAASDELLLVQGIETIPRLCLADDYPYKNSTPDTVDPWNFYTRECTSYVAWRMNRDAGSTTSPYWFTNNSLDGASCLWGNAENWDDNAASLGFVIDNVPEVGAIAQWNPNESGASSWGHVACVEQVNGDGSVDVSEYNWTTQFAYDVRSNRYAPRYIHVTKFHAGDNILADSTLNVRATAGGTYIDQVTAGRAGTVTGGPTGAVYGGTFYKWYNVNWGSALSGWSTESGLTKSTADTAAPMVSAFSITPTSVTVGSAVTISYTVSDTAGSGLKQVELWRTTDTDGDGEPDWSQDPEGYIAMKPLSGQQSSGYFEDSPSSASTYWYGLHVVDNAGNWSAEPAPPGPITVTVVAPHIITNVYELQAMNSDLAGWYVLGNDIDASVTRTWNDGAGFIPVGSAYSNYFGGHFDGRGYTISGLYVNRPETDNVGLFGYAHYNVIEDVGLTGVDITGRDGVGGLIGVSGYSGSRDRCYTTGIVRGRAYVGGLIGGNGRTPITDCYSHADVYGVSFVGGLIGSNSAYSGGTSEQIEVKHCYSSGLVVGEPGGQPVGGLVGHSMQTNWISCYWDVEASGQTTSTGGLGKTTQEMKQQATFVEWDFADTWMMPAGDYPRLIGVESSEVGRIVLTEPLETTYGPYILGDSLTATFTVQNTGDGAITLDKLLLGGRFNDGELPGGGYPDFSYDTVTLQPGESYAYQGTLTIPEPGAYDFFIAYYIENPTDAEKDFLDANNWDTNVELDTGLTDADRTRHIEAVSPPPGYAVIVAGDADWRQKFAIDHSANNAYRALRNLGFDDDHIFYLNTVQQQVAGASVVDGSPSQEDLQDCLDSIKQQIGDRLTPLILYLVGHGLGEVFDFYTDSEPLSSHNLRDMLAPFEGNPTLVVLGSCYSGSFITQRFTADPDSISSDNRIVITAAHDDEERTSLLGLGGWYHSSDRFWGNLSEGMNVRNAFETGAWPGERQHLWLDDNGDCTGHSPGDLADDGVLASSMIVGVPGTEHLVLTSWYSVWIHSPGELRVYDSENRVTGLVNGEIKEEIPGVMYYPEDEMVVVYSLSDTYRYEVVATDGGTYGLDIVLVQEGEAVVFAATDIPVTVGTRHEYAVDWAALSRGEEAVTLNVDAEGDGVFEQTITADATLQPPVANAGGPYSGFTGEPIVLDASGSNDPDGQISLYEWDWNGDGVYDYGTGSAQCGHTWPSAFNGNIVLRVTDDDGLTNTATATATVTVNEAPTLTTLQTLIGAHKGYPYTITYESLATAANEVDPDGDVVRFRIESISSGTKSLAKGGINVTPGTPQAILGPAESWVWTPAKGKTGVLDAFTMKAWDGNLASATAVQVKIKVDPVPDLRPTAVDSSVWQSAEPGTLVDWTVTVKNSGRGPQWADWTVQWYLSSDKKYQNTDTLIGSPQTYSDDIAKSASVTKTYNAPVPAVPIAGQKYVIGRVVNTGPDAKASNNTRASKDKDWFGQVDPDADEPNNTLETATDLGTPTGKVARQNLTIDSAQDVDWYKFTMTKAGTSKGKVQIDFTNAEGDLALALYGSGEVPIRQVDKTGKTEVIKLKGLAVGTYHLKVLSLHGDVSRNYRVTLIL
jgi:surface antigen